MNRPDRQAGKRIEAIKGAKGAAPSFLFVPTLQASLPNTVQSRADARAYFLPALSGLKIKLKAA